MTGQQGDQHTLTVTNRSLDNLLPRSHASIQWRIENFIKGGHPSLHKFTCREFTQVFTWRNFWMWTLHQFPS